MSCLIGDLWRALAWWLAGPLHVLALLVLMLWAPRVKRRWLKTLLRTGGGLAASFLVAIFGLGVLFSAGDPRPQYRSTDSPSGLHRATLMCQAGFLGRDVSEVKITTKNSCKRLIAYGYDGPSDLTSTQVTWLDDFHLQIKYRLDRDRYQHCEAQVADVSVACTPLTAGTN